MGLQTLGRSIERWGNALPHPVILFLSLWLFIVAITVVASALGWSVEHPATGETIVVKSLLSVDGIGWWLSNAVDNFTDFAPVGPVLVVMLGIGIAEKSGYLSHLLTQLLPRQSGAGLTVAIVFVAILSSIAFDAGYVVVIPLSAALFYAAGRSPILGIAASFAGVSGGYSANLMVGPVDFMLAGITTEAAQLLQPEREILPTSNWYFMATSVVMLTVVITFVVEYYLRPLISPNSDSSNLDSSNSVFPNLVASNSDEASSNSFINEAPPECNKSEMVIWPANILALFLIMAIGGFVLLADTSPTLSPLIPVLLQNISILIGLIFMLAGTCFGLVNGRYRATQVPNLQVAAIASPATNQWVSDLESSWRQLIPYLVLMFFAAQFVNSFAWSQLGLLVAVAGADTLTAMSAPPAILLAGLVLLTATINLVVGSASAKWALLAPVLVPMFMLVGVAPELTQLGYRIGDSSSNIVTPLMPYFPLILILMQKYQPTAGVGTLLALMLPLSIALLLSWIIMLIIWLSFGFPVGPSVVG